MNFFVELKEIFVKYCFDGSTGNELNNEIGGLVVWVPIPTFSDFSVDDICVGVEKEGGDANENDEVFVGDVKGFPEPNTIDWFWFGDVGDPKILIGIVEEELLFGIWFDWPNWNWFVGEKVDDCWEFGDDWKANEPKDGFDDEIIGDWVKFAKEFVGWVGEVKGLTVDVVVDESSVELVIEFVDGKVNEEFDGIGIEFGEVSIECFGDVGKYEDRLCLVARFGFGWPKFWTSGGLVFKLIVETTWFNDFTTSSCDNNFCLSNFWFKFDETVEEDEGDDVGKVGVVGILNSELDPSIFDCCEFDSSGRGLFNWFEFDCDCCVDWIDCDWSVDWDFEGIGSPPNGEAKNPVIGFVGAGFVVDFSDWFDGFDCWFDDCEDFIEEGAGIDWDFGGEPPKGDGKYVGAFGLTVVSSKIKSGRSSISFVESLVVDSSKINSGGSLSSSIVLDFEFSSLEINEGSPSLLLSTVCWSSSSESSLESSESSSEDEFDWPNIALNIIIRRRSALSSSGICWLNISGSSSESSECCWWELWDLFDGFLWECFCLNRFDGESCWFEFELFEGFFESSFFSCFLLWNRKIRINE